MIKNQYQTFKTLPDSAQAYPSGTNSYGFPLLLHVKSLSNYPHLYDLLFDTFMLLNMHYLAKK